MLPVCGWKDRIRLVGLLCQWLTYWATYGLPPIRCILTSGETRSNTIYRRLSDGRCARIEIDGNEVYNAADVFRWRFTSGEETTQFAYFKDGKRHDKLIQGDLATAVAGKFGIDLGTVRRALELVMTEC